MSISSGLLLLRAGLYIGAPTNNSSTLSAVTSPEQRLEPKYEFQGSSYNTTKKSMTYILRAQQAASSEMGVYKSWYTKQRRLLRRINSTTPTHNLAIRIRIPHYVNMLLCFTYITYIQVYSEPTCYTARLLNGKGYGVFFFCLDFFSHII